VLREQQRLTARHMRLSPVFLPCLLHQRQGPSVLGSPLSSASLCSTAHPDLHQYASRHAGVCQWPVSTNAPSTGMLSILTTPPHRGRSIIPTIQSDQLRLKDIKELAQGHTATKWGSQDSNLGVGALSKA
jgi:hypothetical protein